MKILASTFLMHDNRVTREFANVEETESVLSSNLLGLKMSVQNKLPFFRDELKLDSYFRDKKDAIQPNLVGNFLLARGYKYQFFSKFI